MIKSIKRDSIYEVSKKCQVNEYCFGISEGNVNGKRCSKKIKIKSSFITRAETYCKYGIIRGKKINIFCNAVMIFRNAKVGSCK
jgi:hypothetical protein